MAWLLLGVPALAGAQLPDVRVRLDARLSYHTVTDGATSLRLYDPLGRGSTFALTLFVDPGLRALLSQYLEQVAGSIDPLPFEEAYIEDEGIWRAGKQYLPYGRQTFIRESVPALRGDLGEVANGLRGTFAVFDAGAGRPSGAVGRIEGKGWGASAALGNHLTTYSTSLTLIRLPQEAPGEGRGYQQAFGIDLTRKVDEVELALEAVALRQPNSALDSELDLFDLSATWMPDPRRRLQLGWTQARGQGDNFFRILGSFPFQRNFDFEPMARVRNASLFDFALTMRVRF